MLKANVAAYLEFRYEKIRRLKKSERGEVWLAINKSTNQPVIMKMINSIGLPYLRLKENSHPLPAKIFYCAESESDTVVVEEFIAGETLDGKSFSESEVRGMLLQLCDGLKFLHGLGIIHRDIKPSNLILQAGGIIRLIDFDAARFFDETKTADTKLLGTKGYAPPEQFGFGQTDARSDIYSLGKTFLELLVEDSSSLKKILAKCVEVDPKNRYQNVDELKIALTAKNFGIGKICATVAFLITGIFLIFNSTVNKNIPATNEEILPKIAQSALVQIVEVPAKIETPAEVAGVPKTKNRDEILQPLPQTNTLENFQPSFPTAPTFNPETVQNLGGVKIGDSLENVRAILGNEVEIIRYDGFNFVNHFYKNLNVTIENNQATCITTKNADVATLRGIRQGDSLEKVLAIYGDNFNTRQFGNISTYIYKFDSAELRFSVKNNFVTAITLISVDDEN